MGGIPIKYENVINRHFQYATDKLVRNGYASVLCGVLFLMVISCQSQDTKVNQTRSSVNTPTPIEKEYINPTLIFYTLLEDVPCSITLKTYQLRDFTSHFYSGSLVKWFSFDAVIVDTVVNIDVKLREAYSFITGFNNSSYYRNGFNSYHLPFYLKATSNPDSLTAISAPMLTRDACKSFFNVPDSVYLFYSFDQYSTPSHSIKDSFIQHIFYNHHRSSYSLMTMDTMGQIIDSVTLCAITDTTSSYVFRFAIPSALQVIRHKTVRKPDYYFKEDSFEIKRIYTSPDGQIYDWTDTIISLDRHWQTIPPDSVFGYAQNRNMSLYAVPLPLGLETSLKRFLVNAYNATTREIFTRGDYGLDLFYMLHVLHHKNSAPSIILGLGEQIFLAIFDEQGRVSDAKEMSRVDITNSENPWTHTYARLGPQQHIFLIKGFKDSDTIDEWKIERSKIIPLKRKQPLLTVPFGILDQYFPFKAVTEFDMQKVSEQYNETGSFPDSIFKCIEESAKLNGGFIPSGNYSVTHTSNGLTYWTFLHEGGISGSVRMMIIDRNNILRRGTFELASSGGDEGDYWFSKGYFINDSTYYQTGKSCSFQTGCDSIVQIFRISYEGKIAPMESLSEYFKVPYR